MPWPWSATVSCPSVSRTVTVPRGGLHLAALSSRLVTARSRAAGSPMTHHGSACRSKCRPAPAGGPGDGALDDLGEVDLLQRDLGRLVAGELGEVADQRGELLDLELDVVHELGPGPAESPPLAVGLGQQVQVGAQRGQRGPQLVAGVRDELALPVPGGRQRGQHRVEGAGQPGDLVVALDLDRVELLGAGDVLGGVR